MRTLVTIGAYLASLVVAAVTAFFAVLFLVGPHGGWLPQEFEKPVLILGWLCVLVAPVLIAAAVWRRGGKRVPAHRPPSRG
jgi:mannitol-specific phosphotransferase system IIBC component